jgi:hypothetical protein
LSCGFSSAAKARTPELAATAAAAANIESSRNWRLVRPDMEELLYVQMIVARLAWREGLESSL